jgi:putative membrane protein
MRKYIGVCLAACCCLNAAGFKIPEQSGDSIALLNSNVATSFGPDAAYNNPANMIFLDGGHYLESSLTYLRMSKTKYRHYNGDKLTSKRANALVPTFHFVTPQFDDWRFGLSVVVPAGMSMRWDERLPKATSKKFDLKVIEVNPSVAYALTDNIALGFGLRAVYARGEAVQEVSGALPASQDIKGDRINFGYNAAITYKPTSNLSLAATYRSKVNMNLKGDTGISAPAHPMGLFPNGSYSGNAKLSVPLPASLNLALSYKIAKTTLLFDFERTYWSAWKELDFNYPGASAAHYRNPFFAAFDASKKRDWKDSNAYRIGVAHDATDKLRLMGAVTFDEAASRAGTTGFDLPDTKAVIYAAGFNYKLTDALELGASYFYQDRKARDVHYYSNASGLYPNGKFERGNAQAINLNVKYKF